MVLHCWPIIFFFLLSFPRGSRFTEGCTFTNGTLILLVSGLVPVPQCGLLLWRRRRLLLLLLLILLLSFRHRGCGNGCSRLWRAVRQGHTTSSVSASGWAVGLGNPSFRPARQVVGTGGGLRGSPLAPPLTRRLCSLARPNRRLLPTWESTSPPPPRDSDAHIWQTWGGEEPGAP